MERETCAGTRKGKMCGAPLFKCGHADCGSVGCEKSGCDHRQFTPIERCKDCGRSYDRIKQYKTSAALAVDAGSSAVGRPLAMPKVELLFGGVLGLVALLAAGAALSGFFRGDAAAGGATAAPDISVAATAPATIAYADLCQCYKEGMSLAGTGLSVLSSQYRTGFVQCRAAFGTEGGDAWTAGWSARVGGKMVGAGCKSWRRGAGR